MRNLIIVLISILFLVITVMAKADSIELSQPQVTTLIPYASGTSDPAPQDQIGAMVKDQQAEQKDDAQSPATPPQDAIRKLTPEDVAAPIAEALASHKDFNGLFLLAQGDTVLYSAAIGMVPGQNLPYTQDTAFLLASITKQFTAVFV
jgi:CubicO group peptidase (beta-lactamase class C family)